MADAYHYFDSPVHGALTYYAWTAPPDARASLVFLHGWGDHGGRYAALAQLLVRRLGIACYAPDFAGHGRSPGPRARVHDFALLVGDLRAFLRQVPSPGPVFLCGHSMGGCLAAHLALTDPEQLAGVIFNSGALALHPRVSRARRALARSLGAAWPTLPVGTLKQPAHMARSLEAQRAYRADALVHHGAIDAGTALCLMRALEQLAAERARLRVPFLALTGGADELVAPEGPLRLQREASADGTVLHYPEARHDLLLELGPDALANAISQWLAARL